MCYIDVKRSIDQLLEVNIMWSCYTNTEELRADLNKDPVGTIKKVLASLRPMEEGLGEIAERLKRELVEEMRASA